MARFKGTFEGRTTGGGGDGLKVTAGGVLAAVGAGIVLTHPHQSAQAAGTAAVIGAAVFGAVLVAAVVFVFLRVRGHRRGTGDVRRPSPLLATVSPPVIPVREARALPAVAPEIHIHLGPDLAAYFAERDPAPVYRVHAEPIEQQELPR